MSLLEINIHEDKKVVDVWLTKAEKHDENVSAQLKQLYAKYKNTEYTVAVFESGSKDLYQQTLDLCLYNRNRMAAAQVYRERMAQSPCIETNMDSVISENAPAWAELAKGHDPQSLSS